MFIGIDWGGTKMEVIALDRDGETRARHRVATPTSGYDDCIRAVVDLVGIAERMAGETGSVGIGIPGSPNPRSGLVRNSNAVLLNGRPLGRDLEKALGRPVRLANDANCLRFPKPSTVPARGPAPFSASSSAPAMAAASSWTGGCMRAFRASPPKSAITLCTG